MSKNETSTPKKYLSKKMYIEQNMKKIVVLGAAESGAGAAVLAKKEGFDVFVSDMATIKD